MYLRCILSRRATGLASSPQRLAAIRRSPVHSVATTAASGIPSHRPPPPPHARPAVAQLIFLAAGMAAAAALASAAFLGPAVECEGVEEPGKYAKWKEDKIGAYENRIRAFSHPLKVFHYFASAHKHGEAYMTTEDFIRSLIPYRSYHSHDRSKVKRVASADAFFSLADTDGDGLISFSEYMIFLCLLGTPEFHWKISFKLFDVNGDGTVSKDEFEKIMMHHATGLGFGSRLGTNERSQVDVAHSGIYKLFFGHKGEKNMVYDEFIDFMRRLHLEVLKLEFHQFNVDEPTDSIDMRDFALSLVNYAPARKIKKLVERADHLPPTSERITFAQFYDFDQMVRTRLHDLGLAYKLYNSMESGLDRLDFRRVVKAVTKTELTPGQVEVIYALFDLNGDGFLNSDEFYAQVMKGRHSRGLDTARDTGISLFFQNLSKCVREAYEDQQ
ncbi:hypothetical protein BDZ88DRAFT_402761 [Geranomyces variabilis]|nr:hypothetical protein BDZ88DRAFT_402761 [Geranomyces variabilis]KAJ3143028.1 hypothetical protein HDU90_002902 [Geranomyces variabilis]